jgi:hypothetical protein
VLEVQRYRLHFLAHGVQGHRGRGDASGGVGWGLSCTALCAAATAAVACTDAIRGLTLVAVWGVGETWGGEGASK